MTQHLMLACLGALIVISPAFAQGESEKQWYRGNTHAHTLWSDGNEFPEMVVDWYKRHGYDFLAISDHNTLHQGERWMDVKTAQQRAGDTDVLGQYIERFGDNWVQTRRRKATREVRLQPFHKYRARLEEPGEFLLIRGEEITDKAEGKPIHLNAVNLKQVIQPQHGSSVRETMRRNLEAVKRREQKTGRPVLVHLNHPNFGWAISARDLAHVVPERFFEVYNGHPHINHKGNANHPGDEDIWDIANTIRIARLEARPLFGLATDDSHRYHGGNNPPGRGWIMVRAAEPAPAALIRAMRKGDFYASTGVTLNTVRFDAATGRLRIDIQAEPGVTYTTRFIGTRIQKRDDGRRETGRIGKTLAERTGETPTYTLQGDELYIRATITSSKPHPKPSFEGQHEQAWTQPVGWRERVVGRAGGADNQ